MSVKIKLDKINKNVYLTTIIIIFKIWDIIKPVFKSYKMNSTVTEYFANRDWTGDILFFVVVILLYKALENVRKLKAKITQDAKELEEYRIAKGNYEKDINESFFTSLQVLVAYVNSFTDQKEVEKIADMLYDAHIIIPNCEKIGLSKAIIASMWMKYHAIKLVEQERILEGIYPDENQEIKKEEGKPGAKKIGIALWEIVYNSRSIIKIRHWNFWITLKQ